MHFGKMKNVIPKAASDRKFRQRSGAIYCCIRNGPSSSEKQIKTIIKNVVKSIFISYFSSIVVKLNRNLCRNWFLNFIMSISDRPSLFACRTYSCRRRKKISSSMKKKGEEFRILLFLHTTKHFTLC